MMQAMPARPSLGTRALALVALLLGLGTVIAFAVLLSALTPMRPAWYLGALIVATALAAAALWQTRHWLTVTSFVMSLLLLGAATFFHFVAMRVPFTRPALVVGQPAPDFMLPDATGRPVRLADYRGHKPVVLVFYRGYW
jgi:hypothetical protein